MRKDGLVAQQYLAVKPEICDGCTAAVEFRPLVIAQLLSVGEQPGAAERFCPTCARVRRLGVSRPEGMEYDVLYGQCNPSYHYHIERLLRTRVLKILSQDADLRARDITGVGATISGSSVELSVSRRGHSTVPVSLNLKDLARREIRSEMDLLNEARVRIHQALSDCA
ncbi:MAG: hypothetical protein KAW17_02145 [Candidatus Eisenbacteria sp.]|nr:hypothetical protein [Candidatus Eisenbacteria bacterium]